MGGLSRSSIQDCQFYNCISQTYGGAIHAQHFGSLKIQDSTFSKNEAKHGSDIYALNSASTLHIKRSNFSGSLGTSIHSQSIGANITYCKFQYMYYQKSDPVLHVVKARELSLSQNAFRHVSAGSVVKIEERMERQHQNITIMKNVFQHIECWEDGGAISAIQPNQICIEMNLFSDLTNKKVNGRGGAIFYQSSSGCASFIMRNHFINCSADFSGAIHWNLEEPFIVDNSYYQTGSKYYADKIGSYGTQIQIINEQVGYKLYYGESESIQTQGKQSIEFKGLRSGGEIPPFYAAIVDQYSQIVTSTQGETIYTIARQLIEEGQHQSSYNPLLSNFNNNTWRNGVIKIDKLKMIGEPGRSYQIIISTPIIDSELPAIKVLLSQRVEKNVMAKVHVSFRLCQSGEEFLSEGECRKCRKGSYLLIPPTQPTPCKICPEHAICLGGDKIGPQAGFWRSNRLSEKFYPCFYQGACLGTFPDENYSPEGSCRKGYEGKLCGSCEKGYTRNSYYQCTKCPHPTVNFIITIFLLGLFSLLLIISVKCSLRSALKKQSLFTVYFKILVNHLQILMLISSFDFDWPSEVQSFLSTSQTLTDSPSQMFSIDCLVNSAVNTPMKRFYIYSLIYFFIPVIIAISAFLFWTLKYLRTLRIVCRKLTATLLIIYFIIHPSITRVTLQLFDCTYIDGNLYLTQEPDQKCWVGQHLRFSFSIGMLGIVLWSLGIPLVSCFLLRRHRNYLDQMAVKEKLGFLYNGYTSRSYYWEVVMSTRKVIIAFVSIFLTSEGSITQSLVLLVVLVFSIFLNFKVNPFTQRNINRLQILSLIALIITAYCGVFFLSARNPHRNEYTYGKDFTLSTYKRWILFCAIVIANLVFVILWIFRLILEVKSKLIERFPRCYRTFCLCCSRIKLSKQQSLQKTSEQNQLLIHRIQDIKAKLDSYISRLEGNQQILQQAPLEQLVDGVSYGIRNLEKWRERKLDIDRKRNLQFGHKKGSAKEFKVHDLDLDTAMSTGRSLRKTRLRNQKFEERVAREKKEFLKRFNSFKTPERELVTFFDEDNQNETEQVKDTGQLDLSKIEQELGLEVDSDNPSTDRGYGGTRYLKKRSYKPSRFRLPSSPVASIPSKDADNYEETEIESPRKPITASTTDALKRCKESENYDKMKEPQLKRLPKVDSYSE